MNRTITATALSLFAAPVFAHEIAAGHAHAGPVVLIELPQALLFAAAAGALLAFTIYTVKRRSVKKSARFKK